MSLRPGSHWLLATGIVVALLLVACVAWVGHSDRGWMPSVRAHRRQLRGAAIAAIALVVGALLTTQLHHLTGLLKRIQGGDPWWLACGIGVEVLSFVGYVGLTKHMLGRRAPRLDWAAATEITFGGVVATRLLSAGGAGGIAFTTWALRAAGMATRTAADMIAAFLALLYIPYIAALMVGWIGGGVPDAVSSVSLALGAVTTIVALLLALIPSDIERRARRLAAGHGLLSGLAARLATVPAIAGSATRSAFSCVSSQPRLLGWAVLWWGADVATLGACFKAFGGTPTVQVLVIGYFVGHIGNLLPLPGGIGGVEGGMIGVFVACGVPASLAVVGTLAYQVISTWLPVLPGLGAYWSLRRRVARWRAQDEHPAVDAPLQGAAARG